MDLIISNIIFIALIAVVAIIAFLVCGIGLLFAFVMWDIYEERQFLKEHFRNTVMTKFTWVLGAISLLPQRTYWMKKRK